MKGHSRMKVGVCISTVNEVETIGALVSALRAWDYAVYVVDASEDDTWYVAKECGAIVNLLPEPQGIAEHLKKAWQMALDGRCDLIVQMDAGGSHDPNDLPKFLKALQKSDMVLGSRFCKGAHYAGNVQRAFMSQVAAQLCNFKRRTRFTDWTSGYRAFTAETLRTLSRCKYAARMHAFQIEVLDTARALRFDIAEVPITYTAGRSSFNQQVAKEAMMIYQLM